MNVQIIDRVKECTNEVLRLSSLEERILQQKSKIDWLKLGDGNNSYFHTTLKIRHRQDHLEQLKDENDRDLIHQEEIEGEIPSYYKNLIGTSNNLISIDLVAMRNEPQLSQEQRDVLSAPHH
ncbi:unnamed protein product [Lathyrus sativus]|nr:unnamed protein product [Lathyrus sativus]